MVYHNSYGQRKIIGDLLLLQICKYSHYQSLFIEKMHDGRKYIQFELGIIGRLQRSMQRFHESITLYTRGRGPMESKLLCIQIQSQ